MTYGNRAVLFKQQKRLGLADDIRAPHDHALLALDRNTTALKQYHHTRRRARKKIVVADHNTPHIIGVEGIYILFGVDSEQDLFLIKVLRQGQLHQNAVNALVMIQLVDQREQLRLGRISRKLEALRVKADLLAGAVLVAHVNLRCGVLTHNHHGKARSVTVFLFEFFGIRLDLAADLSSNLLAVNQLCHFLFPPCALRPQ